MSLLQSVRYSNIVLDGLGPRPTLYWKHVKVFLNAYNRQTNYIYYISNYMFACLCRARAINPFTTFLHVIRQIDWSLHPAHTTDPTPPKPHNYVPFFLLHLTKLLHWSPHILSITPIKCFRKFGRFSRRRLNTTF
jgi:hypothetical protein